MTDSSAGREREKVAVLGGGVAGLDRRARVVGDAGAARPVRGHRVPTRLAVRRQVRDRPRPGERQPGRGARAAPVVRRLRQRVQVARRLLRRTGPAARMRRWPRWTKRGIRCRACCCTTTTTADGRSSAARFAPRAGMSLGGRARSALVGPDRSSRSSGCSRRMREAQALDLRQSSCGEASPHAVSGPELARAAGNVIQRRLVAGAHALGRWHHDHDRRDPNRRRAASRGMGHRARSATAVGTGSPADRTTRGTRQRFAHYDVGLTSLIGIIRDECCGGASTRSTISTSANGSRSTACNDATLDSPDVRVGVRRVVRRRHRPAGGRGGVAGERLHARAVVRGRRRALWAGAHRVAVPGQCDVAGEGGHGRHRDRADVRDAGQAGRVGQVLPAGDQPRRRRARPASWIASTIVQQASRLPTTTR